LAALEDFFLFLSDETPEKSSPALPSPSLKSAPMSPIASSIENHDISILSPNPDTSVQGPNTDENFCGVRTRRPSSLFLNEQSDILVNDTVGPMNDKEKKGRWQGLLSSSKVPSSFSRRPSIPDDSVLRLQRQTEKVMMRRLQSSVTYKLALLESHMHRHEDAQVSFHIMVELFAVFDLLTSTFEFQYHYESALRMYSDNPRHPRVAAILLGLGCL
jgi:hypothetical protein